MSLVAAPIAFWRRKRRFDVSTSANRSALRVCGHLPQLAYTAGVAKLRSMISVFGHTRPTEKRPLGRFGANQSSRHNGWDPPGFRRLNELSTAEEFFRESEHAEFPLDAIEPQFPADLRFAIDKICCPED